MGPITATEDTNMAESKSNVSFRKKEPVNCPVCGEEVYDEVLRQGGGRLVAGNLTDELRRLYKPSAKYGKVYPQAYSVRVCPKCLYASYPEDWKKLDNDEIAKLRSTTQARQQSLQKILGPVKQTDFYQDRNLELGAGSYMLAVDCYNFRQSKVAPTFKKALSSLRAAWLFTDMTEEYPDLPYQNVVTFFYKKAYTHYTRVLDLLQSGEEKLEDAGRMGPDTDKEWGYQGLQYIVGVLVFRFAEEMEQDLRTRIDIFERSRRMLAKMFGSGKADKNFPADLVDKTRDIHARMGELIDEWEEQLGESNNAEA